MNDKIAKSDFKILFYIEFMNINNPKLLSSHLSITQEQAENKLIRLEKEKLIVIDYREGKIYGSQLTEKGKEIYEDEDKYLDWKLEFGY